MGSPTQRTCARHGSGSSSPAECWRCQSGILASIGTWMPRQDRQGPYDQATPSSSASPLTQPHPLDSYTDSYTDPANLTGPWNLGGGRPAPRFVNGPPERAPQGHPYPTAIDLPAGWQQEPPAPGRFASQVPPAPPSAPTHQRVSGQSTANGNRAGPEQEPSHRQQSFRRGSRRGQVLQSGQASQFMPGVPPPGTSRVSRETNMRRPSTALRGRQPERTSESSDEGSENDFSED